VAKPTPDFLELLKILSKHEVDFIVVGGVCAVLHGAPVTTFDLDIVHSRSRKNITRLVSALEELEAYYRERKDKQITPKQAHLASPGHHLLMTKSGPLDLLGTIGRGHTYNDLLPRTVELNVSDRQVRMLGLEVLIQVKKETITEKDKIIIPILQRTLEEKVKGKAKAGKKNHNSGDSGRQ
jgi:predicted nucleotidyltransferase